MYCPPESGNIEPSSAKAKAAHIEINAPMTQTKKNNAGCGKGPAMSFAVRKIDEPMMPPASSRTESRSDSPRTRPGEESVAAEAFVVGCTVAVLVGSMRYPIPSSSGDSRGDPHCRQITAAQSPQVRGSVTSRAHCGQYSAGGLAS